MKSDNEFRRGLIDGIPIGLAYVAVSFAFGISGASKGIPVWALTLISATCVTSAGQFAAIIINLRYSIMSIAIGQKLSEKSTLWNRISMAFMVTDEIFAVSCAGRHEITPRYFYALMSIPWISWTIGTLLGATANTLLPLILRNALGLAIYGMLIGIIIPPARQDKHITIVIILSMIVSLLFKYIKALSFISSGFVIIICTLIAATFGAILFPVEEEETHES